MTRTYLTPPVASTKPKKGQVARLLRAATSPARTLGSHSNRAGFSLVEVLISIFVLALGLLGVAAVFPAIVRQQRNASDTVQGVSIQRSVEELLKGNAKLREKTVITPITNGVNISPRGWSLLAGNAGFSTNGSWNEAALITADTPTDTGVSINTSNGTMHMAWPTIGTISLPIAERLIPRPQSGGLSNIQPRFVWDFIARRVPAGEGIITGANLFTNFPRLDDDVIQAAIFVRRIDPSIRVPNGTTLAREFTRLNPTYVPVAVDDAGRPSFDGRGVFGATQAPQYSPIRNMTISFALASDGASPDPTRIIANDETTLGVRAVRETLEQVGQKFVDALGVVHEVKQLNAEIIGGDRVIIMTIDPPFATRLLRNANGEPNTPLIFFTPQVPASVSVITIRR